MDMWERKLMAMRVCMGGKDYGERNTEGEMLLEFADAMKLVILNTWFTQKEPKKVTYESEENNTVVDYMLVRECDLAKVTDINVIGSEECVQQVTDLQNRLA